MHVRIEQSLNCFMALVEYFLCQGKTYRSMSKEANVFPKSYLVTTEEQLRGV